MEKDSTIRMRATTTIISISENPRALRENMNPFFLRGGLSEGGFTATAFPGPVSHLGVEPGVLHRVLRRRRAVPRLGTSLANPHASSS